MLDEPTRSPASLIKRVDSLCYSEYTAIIQFLTSNPLLVRSTLNAALSTFSIASIGWMSCSLEYDLTADRSERPTPWCLCSLPTAMYSSLIVRATEPTQSSG